MFILKIKQLLHPLPNNTDILNGWYQTGHVLLTSEAGLPVELAVAVVEGAVRAAHLPPPPPLPLPLPTPPPGLARGALPPLDGQQGCQVS